MVGNLDVTNTATIRSALYVTHSKPLTHVHLECPLVQLVGDPEPRLTGCVKFRF